MSFFIGPRLRHSSRLISLALFRSLKKVSSSWRAKPTSRMPSTFSWFSSLERTSMLLDPTTENFPSTTTVLACIIVGWYS